MKELKCLCFTDQEVNDICGDWAKDYEVRYEGGQVTVSSDEKDAELDFGQLYREKYPGWGLGPHTLTIYDYGNIIFRVRDVAAIVIDEMGLE